MIYYTGDIHGVPWKICQFCKKIKPTADDVIVILGDVGANFYGDERDNFCKYHLNRFAPTIFRVIKQRFGMAVRFGMNPNTRTSCSPKTARFIRLRDCVIL